MLYLGRLDPEKRVDVLVEAMARARDPGLRLLLVGRGVQEGRLHALRRRLGLVSRVHFLDFVSDAALPGVFGAADIFAMPSEAELQSIATLQALAVGLPVIAADAVALPELVRAGWNGALFRPGDPGDLARHLDELSGDPARRATMAQAARAVAARHDQKLTVAQYERLYQVVTSGPRGSPGMGRSAAPAWRVGSGSPETRALHERRVDDVPGRRRAEPGQGGAGRGGRGRAADPKAGAAPRSPRFGPRPGVRTARVPMTR